MSRESLNAKSKRCTKCRRRKAVREFHKDAHVKSKLSPHCKACHRKQHKLYYLRHKAAIYAQQRIYNAANAERRREWYRSWRARNRKRLRNYFAAHPKKLPGSIRRRRKRGRDYYRDNRARLLRARRLSNAKNRDPIRANARVYRARNPEKLR